jgi:hypothetical protein
MSSRDINLLTPSCKAKCLTMIDLAAKGGLVYLKDWIITCTARLVKEQIALYAQGREPLHVVNLYRRIAGLIPISAQDNLRKVTWTLKSKHLIDLDDGITTNDLSRAFDFAVVKDKKAIWDLKVSVDDDSIPDYEELASYGKQAGLNCGFYWKKQDPPHCEDTL